MSNWKVIKTKIEVFDHPDAAKLQIGKIGTYQVVVQKGLYNGGEDVVFAPEKSILNGELEKEYKNYLHGPDKNRVGSIRLRGELSCGIIIPNELVFAQCGKHISELPNDEDLSEILGITKYVPRVPSEMEGVAVPIEYDNFSIKHDVEQFGVYAADFVDGERVVITEKLHGSQLVAYISVHNDNQVKAKWVSTKNYNAEGLCLVESDTNFYWMAVNDIGLFSNILDLLPNLSALAGLSSGDEMVVQVFGEGIPCQAMKYGFVNPTMKIFGVTINGKTYPYDQLPEYFRKNWVPVLYDGPYENVPELKKLALGNEKVSGQELHIKEGIVITPYEVRRAKDGTWLKVKVINPKYKETGEEFS
jgi:RNA ligase (TIGR02306 family)